MDMSALKLELQLLDDALRDAGDAPDEYLGMWARDLSYRLAPHVATHGVREAYDVVHALAETFPPAFPPRERIAFTTR